MSFLNPYATRLEEYPELVLNGPEVGTRRGEWDVFFRDRMGRSASRAILEIGCSNAEFLTGRAEEQSDVAFIGMDWKFKVLYKGAKRAHDRGLKNVALLRAKAQELSRMFGEAELDEIWIFFPDPWAKKSQLKNRLVRESFLKDAHRALKPGGAIYFKTDHPGYFQWILSLFGVQQPELLSYDDEAPTAPSRRARQIKVRRLEDSDDLPPTSEVVRGLFRLENMTTDYWGAFARPPRLFSSSVTLFEKLFVKEQLPIYYLELAKI